MKRESRIISEQEAASLIKDGMTIYIGGFSLSSHPMAIVREIIKRGIKDLTVVGAATSSIEMDLMIASGAAKKIITSYVGIEGYMGIAPFFRSYVEDDMIELWEIDESGFYAALRAGSLDLPFMPDRVTVGTDYVKLNPDLKEFKDPINGEKLIAVPAVAPDIALIYAAASDEFGNAQFIGSGFGDRTAIRASTKCIIQAEKIISNEEIRMNAEKTAWHGAEHVVRAPYGAHPFSSPGNYLQDDKWIKEYCAAGEAYLRKRDRGPIDAFLQKWIYEPETHLDYLEKVGIKTLCSLGEF